MPDPKGEKSSRCESCLDRRSPYPNNISNSDSSNGWSFWGAAKSASSSQSSGSGCGDLKGKDSSKGCDSGKDPCGKGSCGEKDEECQKLSTEFKAPQGKCPPMPPPTIPALCKPPWLTCPAKITVPPYPIPKGVVIRPISEGGRSNKCEGGKCSKCGVASPSQGVPKVSSQCPMMKPKCPTAANKGKGADGAGKSGGSFMSKISSFFNIFGGKEKDKK